MADKYFFKYRIDSIVTRENALVDYNTAREQCNWHWRNERADSFTIYDEEGNPVMVRIRGKGTGSKHIPYTNR